MLADKRIEAWHVTFQVDGAKPMRRAGVALPVSSSPKCRDFRFCRLRAKNGIGRSCAGNEQFI
jgi:hypothetical protein